MAQKRKRSSAAGSVDSLSRKTPILPASDRRASRRVKPNTNPNYNDDILDGAEALRASPDSGEDLAAIERGTSPATKKAKKNGVKSAEKDLLKKNGIKIERANEEKEDPMPKLVGKIKKNPTKSSVAAKKASDEIKAFKAEREAAKQKEKLSNGIKEEPVDPEAEGDIAEDLEVVKQEARRPPPVNSDYLPLPWKGRLGYACLNTYLRTSNPPIFSSRTCRIASILAHRHPLRDPTQPEHATKNRPDADAPADIARGQRWVEELGLANARDIIKMLRWNERYGIRFLRLSSEMFPFASHAEYGYSLDFAADVLAEAGKVAGQLGHRLSTHPGQFTQLGSPRPQVIAGSIRDLDYHSQLLSLLKLPEQSDRDAIMVLHMGGVFGSKPETLERFRTNYSALPQGIKDRLVLENDDVSWSVHDLLPVCEDLNIPLVLDFHHHNIIFDSSQVREGTADLMGPLMDRIIATWRRKNKTPKMHYSEPTSQAITGRQRRKHSARVRTLPPCPPDMDLMIEAKDKEQAVLELMRTFRIKGWRESAGVIPFERDDDNRPAVRVSKAKKGKKKKGDEDVEDAEEEETAKTPIKDEEVGMGGPEGRVYWPEGMEEWLLPKKREIKKKEKAEGGEQGGAEQDD